MGKVSYSGFMFSYVGFTPVDILRRMSLCRCVSVLCVCHKSGVYTTFVCFFMGGETLLCALSVYVQLSMA